MIGAADTLDQAAGALGRRHLYDQIHVAPVDTQVQGRLWLGLFMIATILVGAFDAYGPVAWVVGLQLAGLYGFVGLSLLAHRQMMTVSRAAPISQQPVTWRLSAEGFVVSAEGLESRVAWPLVAAAVEEKDRWIFALTPNSNFILPLRVLDSAQAEAVRGLVADARTRGVLGAGVD